MPRAQGCARAATFRFSSLKNVRDYFFRVSLKYLQTAGKKLYSKICELQAKFFLSLRWLFYADRAVVTKRQLFSFTSGPGSDRAFLLGLYVVANRRNRNRRAVRALGRGTIAKLVSTGDPAGCRYRLPADGHAHRRARHYPLNTLVMAGSRQRYSAPLAENTDRVLALRYPARRRADLNPDGRVRFTPQLQPGEQAESMGRRVDLYHLVHCRPAYFRLVASG